MAMRVALIGCGAIGRVIAGAIRYGTVDAILECLYDVNQENSQRLASHFVPKPKVCKSIEEVLHSRAELVVEAASQAAVKSYALKVLEAGKSLMVMSVGALLDENLYMALHRTAKKRMLKVYVPSGAIGGLDALKAAAIGKIYEVKLTTTKNPRGLKGAPSLREREEIDWKKKMVLYEGNAKEAVKEFPANVNVSASIALAGVGPDETKVTIISNPGIQENAHEVSAKGDFGSFSLRFRNLPSPDNPRTSLLAALSAIAVLKRIASPIEVGT
jgi:aspartate dehydrogenase